MAHATRPAKTRSKTLRAKGVVSVIRRGTKFYIRFRDEDGVRRMQFAGVTADEAKAVAENTDEAVALKKHAKLTTPIVTGRSEQMTFEAFAMEYLSVLRATMRPATLKVLGTQIIAFGTFIEGHGNPTMDRITRADADRFLAGEAARGCAQSYLSRQAWALARIWRGAIERGLATENPFARRKFSRLSKLEVRYLQPEELDQILGQVGPRHRDIITLLADTGLRVGEAIGLVWDDVDLDEPNPTLSVTRQGPERALLKTAAARRTIPLVFAPRALAILRRRHDARDPNMPRVFPENATSYNVLLSLRSACEAARQPRIRLHDLRHQFASHLVRARVPFPTVARLLGHADGGALVAKRYGRWAPQDAEAMAMKDLLRFRSTPARPRATSARAKKARPPA